VVDGLLQLGLQKPALLCFPRQDRGAEGCSSCHVFASSSCQVSRHGSYCMDTPPSQEQGMAHHGLLRPDPALRLAAQGKSFPPASQTPTRGSLSCSWQGSMPSTKPTLKTPTASHLQREARYVNGHLEESLDQPTRKLLEEKWHFAAHAVMALCRR